VQGSTATIFADKLLGPSPIAPVSLRLRRVGDTFEVQRSLDGTGWTTELTFQIPLEIRELGLYVGNPSGNAHSVTVSDFKVRPTP